MRSRSLFASILMTCVMVVALLGGTPTADADVTDQSFKKSGKIAKIKAVKRRDRVRIHLPIGPSYVFYDYPYYYSRGYYPTHIGGYLLSLLLPPQLLSETRRR